MKFIPETPQRSLKTFPRQHVLKLEMDSFKTNLIVLLDKINIIENRPKDESEEHLKNDVRDFLRDTYYRNIHAINTKEKKDLVIHLGKDTSGEVGVLIEAKRPSNQKEMVTAENPNKKALHELILYYLDERKEIENFELKQLVITNIHEWFIIDANYFDKYIYRNTQIKKLYETKLNDSKDNPWFYEEIAKIIPKIDAEIPCVYFNIKDYDTILRNDNQEDDKALIALFKVFSPAYLLKIKNSNDSNSLDENFYKELLHILGLEEVNEGGKNIIRRKKTNRHPESLIEATIEALETEDVLHRIPDQAIYGANKGERIFNVSLELCITWINRVLFLKLLEGQLTTYHQGNKEHRFLNTETIQDFDELFKLFHKVLAVNLPDRTEAIQNKYNHVPYLNSSLFEISELEDQTIKINALGNRGQLELVSTTILKDIKKKTATLPTLDYLFRFLDAYNFASEGTEEIREDDKTIINASVLGKVFEKINGYKDGSVFTPAFITMYMCKLSIRSAVVEKFNEVKKWNCKDFSELSEDLKQEIKNDSRGRKEVRKEANKILNSLKICDPAVGSGHFLVSALNELISIKNELSILVDAHLEPLNNYKIEIVNDELIITDLDDKPFEYKYNNPESQRVQKTLFHEKQTIIENCLFGVDINPNSVKICRLRLWIELLKNAYYKEETKFRELETLPNIDINIKCGNSLLSRFALDADLSKALKSIKYDIKAYRGFVQDYKNEKSREVKRGLRHIIDGIKSDFRTEINKNDPKQLKLNKLSGDLFNLLNQGNLFEPNSQQKKLKKEKQAQLETEINTLAEEIEAIKSNAIYKNAFEWRFEFPEVLSNNGNFEGFDVIIGNPPYIRQEEIKAQKPYLQSNYKTYTGTADLYVFFVEKGFTLLKPKGSFSYIMPNKWMQTGYGKPLRAFLLENQLRSIIDFGDLQVFNNVTTYPCILSATNQKTTGHFKSTTVKTLKFEKGFENYVLNNTHQLSLSDLSEEGWMISSEAEQMLLHKIKSNSTSLFNYTNGTAHYGIKTGLTEAFLINTETKNKLITADKNSAQLIKPFLQGRNIKPYASPKADNWLILIPKGFTIKSNLPPDNAFYVNEPSPRYGNMTYDDAWDWFRSHYPAIAAHLLPFKNKAEKRTDQGDFWWELRACDYYEEFENPKIMYQVMQVKPCFIYDNTGQFCNNSMWIIPKDDKFLVGILNSKLGWWLISKYCTAIQNGYQLIWQYFGQIPIVNAPESQKNKMIKLVEKVILLKQQNKDTTILEKEIDDLVFKLYDITENEQKMM